MALLPIAGAVGAPRNQVSRTWIAAGGLPAQSSVVFQILGIDPDSRWRRQRKSRTARFSRHGVRGSVSFTLAGVFNAGQRIKINKLQQATLFDAIFHSGVPTSVVDVFSHFPERLRKNGFQVKRAHKLLCQDLGVPTSRSASLDLPQRAQPEGFVGDSGFPPRLRRVFSAAC